MNPEPRAAVAVTVAAVMVRGAVLALTWNQPLEGDARSYHETAARMLAGAPVEPDWPPGLPALLLPFYAAFGPRPEVGRLVALGTFVAFCFVLYRLASRVGGGRRAVLILAVFVAYPSFVWYSVQPLTQIPSATLLGAALLVTWRLLDQPSWTRAFVLGALLVGLLLLRPSNALLCVCGPVLLAVFRRRVLLAVGPLLVLSVATAGVTAWLHARTGRTVFINDANSRNFYYGNNQWTPLYRTWWFGSHKRGEPGVPDAYSQNYDTIRALPVERRDAAFMVEALAHIASRPDLFLIRTAARIRTMFAFDIFAAAHARLAGRHRLALALLAADAACWMLILMGGAIGLRLSSLGMEAWTAVASIALYSAPYFISFSHPTYHAGFAGILAAWIPSPERELPRLRALGTWGWMMLAAIGLVQVEWMLRMADRL